MVNTFTGYTFKSMLIDISSHNFYFLNFLTLSSLLLDLNWDVQKGMKCATPSDRALKSFKRYADARDACMNGLNCRGFQNDCGRNDEFYLCNKDSQLFQTSSCGTIVYILKGNNLFRYNRKPLLSVGST